MQPPRMYKTPLTGTLLYLTVSSSSSSSSSRRFGASSSSFYVSQCSSLALEEE
jgi:hypothetical protein